MLYHNIINSDKRRVVRRILIAQRRVKRATTWYSNIRKEEKRYNIELNVEKVLNSTWKKHVKQKIRTKTEEEVRKECRKMKKGRTICNNEYAKKEYLNVLPRKQVKSVLRARLHMTKIPGNYKSEGITTCPLCSKEEGSTEHYFECTKTRHLAEIWEVTKEDLKSHQVKDERCQKSSQLHGKGRKALGASAEEERSWSLKSPKNSFGV